MTNSSEKSQNCCEQEINKIYEYLDGAVSKKDVETLKEHLGECTDCTQEHDLELMIRQAIKRSCCEKAPQELKDKIRIGIEEIKNKA